uniref:RING finger protein 207 n=2 Tax=Cacopsylla melanoneura TaxID=428564 RepID=A0A8D8YKE5_9HEMI
MYQAGTEGSGPPETEELPTPTSAGPKNPLLCHVCDDYYTEPCLLSCYHSFCARCLRGRTVDGKLSCPICGQHTSLKEGATLPPPDNVLKQLIEVANAENPPCANCDKRDRNAMYFCSTCGQSLCSRCRENTHRAKMFSTHDIAHLSKCGKETFKRCAMHGEQFIMFSNNQKIMLCVNCFRDTPPESRQYCVDIDTAFNQSSKKMERSLSVLCEVQASVRTGLMNCRSSLDELQLNCDTEKMTIQSFCQGMIDAITKTQNSMIMEVQRQFEAKDRTFRSQLNFLSSSLPILQHHVLLCKTFSTHANKFQFLQLVYPMMERMTAVASLSQPLKQLQNSIIRTNYRTEFAHCLEPWIGKLMPPQHPQSAMSEATTTPLSSQFETASMGASTPGLQSTTPQPVPSVASGTPPSKKQHVALKAKTLEGEGPFSNHCRSFDNQIKELGSQLTNVRDRLGDLHRDITLIRRVGNPPLILRYQNISRDCHRLHDTLERNHVELERLRSVFQSIWQEQLYRIHVEQDIFQSQMNEIHRLQKEVEQVEAVAQQLEPIVKQLSNQKGLDEIASLHNLVDRLTDHYLQSQGQFKPDPNAPKQGDCHTVHICSPNSDPNMFYKDGEISKDMPVKEVSRHRPCCEQTMQIDQFRALSSRGVLSHLIEKVRIKDDKSKKTPPPCDEMAKPARGRSRSEGRGKEIDLSRPKLHAPNSVGRIDCHHSSHSNLKEREKENKRVGGGLVGDIGVGMYNTMARKSHHKEDHSQGGERSHSKERRREYNGGISERPHSTGERYAGERGYTTGERPHSTGERTYSGERPHATVERTHSSTGERQPKEHSSERSHRDRSGERCHRDRSGERCRESSGERERIRRENSGDKIRREAGGDRERERVRRENSGDLATTRRESTEDRVPSGGDKRSHSLDQSDVGKCRDFQEHLENHLKEKIKQRSRASTPHAKDGKDSGDDEYQRIVGDSGMVVPAGADSTLLIHALVHAAPPSPPPRPRPRPRPNVYPHSDTEEIFYTEGPSNALVRRSSMDFAGDDKKTWVLVIGTSEKNKGHHHRSIKKQRSWETFPPKKKCPEHDQQVAITGSKFCRDPDSFRGAFGVDGRGEGLKKADSFEGHEEAVRTIVAAVQETRTMTLKKSQQQKSPFPPKQ